MKRSVLALLAITALLVVSTSQADWRMRVHRGQNVEEISLVGVDSITYIERVVPTMVRVPAGSFVMGDGSATCGVDEHMVTLTHDFSLGQHEVTNSEYMEALQWAYDNGYVTADEDSVEDNLDGSTETLLRMANDYCEIQFDAGIEKFYLRESPSTEAQSAYPGGYNPAVHPVKMVSWYGAAAYCDWLSLRTGLTRAYQHSGSWLCNGGDPYGAQGYRLPTDAEWEYAAQFNDERIYPWGNQESDCSLANYRDSTTTCVGWTTRVGSYPDAPRSLGLWDMVGNVSEMCNDWFLCDLGTNQRVNPAGPPSGTGRVVRGGASIGLDDLSGTLLQSAARGAVNSIADLTYLGFRATRTVIP
jgi:formylglycine-generating enzyme required for sulfatase activity